MGRYIRNQNCENFLNDLEILTKEEIIEVVSYFFDITDMESCGEGNNGIKKTLLNSLKVMINRKVRDKLDKQ